MRFYLFDGQGSTFGMVSGNGTLLGVAGFGAWGKTLASTLPSTPFGWKGQAGQFTDTETGNLYLHRRYYSPKIGRFLSRDPIGFAGGINLYAYCGGDPVNYADPSGLEGHWWDWRPTRSQVIGFGTGVLCVVAFSNPVTGILVAVGSSMVIEGGISLATGASGEESWHNANVAGLTAFGTSTLGYDVRAGLGFLAGRRGMQGAEPAQMASEPAAEVAEVEATQGYPGAGQPLSFNSVTVYRGSNTPNVPQVSASMRGLPIEEVKSGAEHFMTPREAWEHANFATFHPDGVSVTTNRAAAANYGTIIEYRVPQAIFDRLPPGDPRLGEFVFKYSIPEIYRVR